MLLCDDPSKVLKLINEILYPIFLIFYISQQQLTADPKDEGNISLQIQKKTKRRKQRMKRDSTEK